jgi:hypothetical protein
MLVPSILSVTVRSRRSLDKEAQQRFELFLDFSSLFSEVRQIIFFYKEKESNHDYNKQSNTRT